jgi:m7GpppX diphosphatase
VHETPQVLERAEGFIASEILKKQWIYGIIAGQRESEAVKYDEGEYMVLPDADAMNDGTHVVNWLVIFKDLGLRSIRDLRGGHVGLLRRVREKILDLFPSKGCMMYFHCPPSVWQLHLHVSAPCDVLRTTNDMQKVQFLDDVISNLEIDGEYYAKVTLTYVLPVGHEFIRLYHGGGGDPLPS